MSRSLRQLVIDWRNAANILQKLQNDLPRIIGSESVKVVKDNFKLQGYDSGTGVDGWPDRSPATNRRYDKRKGVKGTVYQSSNPLLTQTKDLYNAVRYYLQSKSVKVGIDLTLVPYAQRLNDGGAGKWGKNSTHIPPRPFIPTDKPNIKILKRVLKKVKSEQSKALKDFKK